VRSTIAICDTRNEAKKIEAFLVNENFIKRDDTYNVILGGGNPPINERKIYQYDLNGNFLNEFGSISNAEKTLGVKSGISSAIKYKSVSCGFLWSFVKVDKLNISDYKINIQTKPVYAYNKNGEFVKKYNTISEFCKEHKISLHPVQTAIASKTKARGYYLSLNRVDKFIKEKIKKSSPEIHQYGLDGKFIKT